MIILAKEAPFVVVKDSCLKFASQKCLIYESDKRYQKGVYIFHYILLVPGFPGWDVAKLSTPVWNPDMASVLKQSSRG